MAQQQLLEQLLGTVIPQDNFTEGAPFAQPPLQSQAEPLSDLEVILRQLSPTSPEPLRKGQRIAGGISDAIEGLLAVTQGRRPGPSALAAPIAANKAKAERINQANVRRAQVELGERDRELTQEAKDADREDLQRERRKAARRERMARLSEAERAREFRLHEAKLLRDHQIEMASLQSSDKVADKQFAQKQDKALEFVMENVAATAATLEEKLGTMTPEQIRKQFELAVQVKGLQGTFKERAEDFFEQHVGSVLDAKALEQPPAPSRPVLDIPLTGGGAVNPLQELIDAPVNIMEMIRGLGGDTRIRNRNHGG